MTLPLVVWSRKQNSDLYIFQREFILIMAAVKVHQCGTSNWKNQLIKNKKDLSAQLSRSVMSNCLWPHESQHARPPCPSPFPGVHSDSRPSSQWGHPAISSLVVPFSSCPQSLPASESFPMSQDGRLESFKSLFPTFWPSFQRKSFFGTMFLKPSVVKDKLFF